MAKTVKARWIAPYEAERPDGTILVPGRVADVNEAEARESDNWEPVSKRPPAKDDD